MIEEQIIAEILNNAPVFILMAARALAMIEICPILSTDSVPQVAKIGLAGFAAFSAMPTAQAIMASDIQTLDTSLFGVAFLFLIIGEVIIGIIIGFYISIIFAAFSTAGQFFSLQMGFGASETFDPLSQIENPLMGQYLNLVAMLVFLSMGGFQKLFLGGFWTSVQSLNVIQLINGREAVVTMMLSGLTRLFADAIVIALPILGTLFLTTLATGMISKAAPQINILSEGFPISITVAFLLIVATMPFMVEVFSRTIDNGFLAIENLYKQIGMPIGGEV
ncbi:flagellar biosynthetic protein FliR [Spirochaetia bacterium]|nr:flagellar biosynthetic protein FliR [Spirochaetia bacterium]